MASRALPEMPCGPILELHGQRKRFHVPFALKPLLEEMSRETLKEQPENIFDYLACFMEARVQRKHAEQENKNQRKSWQVHRWSFEASSVLSAHTLEEFLRTLRHSQEEVTHAAVIIQKSFRGHHAREVVKEIRRSREIELHTTDDPKTEGQTEDVETPAVATETPRNSHEPDEIQYLPEQSESEEEHPDETNESDLDSHTYEIEENEMNDYGTEIEEEEESIGEQRLSSQKEEQQQQEEEHVDEFTTLKAPPSAAEIKGH